jgi:hypothetical protein
MEQDETPSRLDRVRVPALDEILGTPFPVLDDGFVRVIDYMGTDESIVQAARVSYGRGTKKVRNDRGLIRYLLRHRHTTPFEMCSLKLHVRVPMDVWRQWIRHRTASVNEYSTRYSIAIDACQRTAPDAWRRQSKGNRQGSAGLVPPEVGAGLTEREAGRSKGLPRCLRGAHRAGDRARAGPQGPAAEHLHGGLLEDGPPQPPPLPGPPDSRERAGGDPGVREGDRRGDRRQVVPARLGGVPGLRLGGRFLSADEAGIVRALAGGDADRARELAIAGDLLVVKDDGSTSLSFEGRETVAKLEDLGYDVDW